MKKKSIALLVTAAAAISLGHLFILSWLIGLAASKYVAGKSSGEPGRLKSVIIPFRSWRIHLHHWLYSLLLIGASSALGFHFISPTITYGVLGGSLFQGIYFYNDWRVIAVRDSSERTKADGAQGDTGRETL